jgi:nucleolar GTP-binding protein
MNKVTRADVEVQPYAFTTKSLYVGHTDYKYLRWQVIDTPGILDRPLEERNTIEMQSVTALAHLRAAVLYVVDISEECGYSLKQQATLFHSIKPLFANKPVLIVCNKTDVRSMDSLSDKDRALIDEMAREAAKVSAGAGAAAAGVVDDDLSQVLLTMSTLTEEGVSAVKTAACDRLLASRVEVKLKGRRANDVVGRIHVSMPKQRDRVARPPVIPPGLAEARSRRDAGERRKTEKDLQEENGGAGVYSQDIRKLWDLKDPSWRYDIMPEIVDGRNVMDFVDPDIDAKLEALEREEEALAAEAAAAAGNMMEEEHLTAEEAETLAAIRGRKAKIVADHRRKKKEGTNSAHMPRTVTGADRTRTAARMEKELGAMGLDASAAAARARSQSRGRTLQRKRSRSAAAGKDTEMADGEEQPQKRIHSSKSRSMSRGRALSLAPADARKGIKDDVQRNKAIKMADKAQVKMGRLARKGEADRHIPDLKPKHLFSGKRPRGTTDRR